MSEEFKRGQRWISNTEAELGLGLVENIEGRHITFYFPAADERRVYAFDNAPLNRVKYAVSEKIKTAAGELLIVQEHIQHNGCIVYKGIDANGEETHVHELELDSHAQFSKPQDRLFSGQLDRDSSFRLRVETLKHLKRQHASFTYGLSGPRVQLLPHQFYIAHQVSQRHAPRVLLADEVGLGKTIEAGLILHQQLLTDRVKRVLIVVPETLLHQWLVEMLRRFNLQFSILDEERCNNIDEAEMGNPFESAQLVLASLDFLKNNRSRHQQAVEAGWDLMIVDEAHHLMWSDNKISEEYQCIDELAQNIDGLLLLTATPEQLGLESHFARLRLLDPKRFYDLNAFMQEQENYRPVNDLVQALLSDSETAQQNEAITAQLAHYLDEKVIEEFQQHEDSQAAIDHVIQSLIDRHGTGRVLFRNTRETVSGFPERELHTYELDLPDQYISDAEQAELDMEVSTEDLIDLKLHPESQHRYQDAWLEFDPRVSWLVNWLNHHLDEKVLLICATAETALALEYFVRVKTASRASAFHEDMSIVERDRAAAYFADDEDGANILICSEIGSEGRNFQFAHHLILFDLPLNPDLLEQRIGRLDRIGQTETVQIHIPHFSTGAQARLLEWYHQGLNAFLHVCSVGHAIFEVFEDQLNQLLIATNDTQSRGTFEQLLKKTTVEREQALEKMQQGRDRLLELNSCHKQHAAEVIDEINFSANALSLSKYMDSVFDMFGVDQQSHSNDCVIIKPTDHMMNAHFPGLGDQGMTATYKRSAALSREDVQFLTWEHPMVLGAMDMVSNGEFGNASFCALKFPQDSVSVDAGTLMIELIYSVYCPAPKHLQIHRYLEENMIRVVVSSNGQDLTDLLSHEDINAWNERVRKQTANEIIQYARPQISQLIEIGEAKAQPVQQQLIKNAVSTLQSEEHDDLERLRALAKVNLNIRADEIEQLENSVDLLEKHLKAAQLKLDAIRLVFVSE